MNNTTNTIESLIPNWHHFCHKYDPDATFIEAFTSRMIAIEDVIEKEQLQKRINIELGILLLHDTEIDSKTYQLLLQSLMNTNI